MTILRSCLVSFAVTTVASLALVANAEAAEQTATRTVKAWDLDLTKPSDVQTLYDRVQAAAARVCRAEAQRDWRATRTLAPTGWRDRCVSSAIEEAVRESGSASLEALHTRGAVVVANR